MAKKYVEIKLEKTRNLRYGMAAVIRIEKHFKKPISQIDFNNITYEDLSHVIHAGLVHEDKELAPEKVVELIDEYSDVQTVVVAMTEAMQEAFGDGKNAQGAANIENGTGTQLCGTPSSAG